MQNVGGGMHRHGPMKREHENVSQNTQTARFLLVQVKLPRVFIKRLKMCLRKYTTRQPLLHLHYPCALIFRVLVRIFVFTFHLPMTTRDRNTRRC